MKKIVLFLLVLGTTASTSFGASKKKELAKQNELLQMQLIQQQQAQQQAVATPLRPGRTARTIEPCIEMSLAESENLRSFGTAKSFVEKSALSEAERDARARMTLMIKSAVEGAARDYARNANKNLDNTAETLGESIMTQYVSQEISNTRILKTSIYDLTDGSVEVYVCIEMRNNFEERISNVLDSNGMLGIENNKERFVAKMAEGLADYKSSQSEAR